MRRLFLIGLLSLPLYGAALIHGPFRPFRIEPFFLIYFGAFALYIGATWLVLNRPLPTRFALTLIFGFAIVFNLILLPSKPSLSDDMYRYVWDGRVQANGINPYRYPSDAPELAYLRDTAIWSNMNRPWAYTIYPPGAQMIFVLTWRLVPDSVIGFKLVMVACSLLAGGLLAVLLRALGERPERGLIFLWNPLTIFEIAHAGHVDALYLPLIVSAMLLRAEVKATSNQRSVINQHGEIIREALIGLLLGVATLIKLYPIMLAIPLWSVRDEAGKRRWRLSFPIVLLITISAGYLVYLIPGVNTLGFLATYQRETFNVGPLPDLMIRWAESHHIDFYIPVNIAMPALVGIVSLLFIIFPARTPREAIQRCVWPIGIYLVVSQNLFSWYVLSMLPLIAMGLQRGRWLGFRADAVFGWWLFSGLVGLSYTIFITGYAQQWAITLQFLPLYGLLIVPWCIE